MREKIPDIKEEMTKAIEQIKLARGRLDIATDPELIDAAIHEQIAAEKRFTILLREIRSTLPCGNAGFKATSEAGCKAYMGGLLSLANKYWGKYPCDRTRDIVLSAELAIQEYAQGNYDNAEACAEYVLTCLHEVEDSTGEGGEKS